MPTIIRRCVAKFLSACFFWSTAFCINSVVSAQGIREFDDLKTLSRLPETKREIEAAFDTSRSQACELLPEGEALELSSFVSTLTERDKRESRKKQLLPASRRHILSVGLEVDPSERANLPLASRSSIVSYLEENFVSIQIRVRQDLLDDKQYFHHRPLAATASFRGSRITQSFEPLVSANVRKFHSLGLFCRNETLERKEAEDFRTLVLLFETEQQVAGALRPTTLYEFAFVRGVSDAIDGELKFHVFVTDKNRTELLYLRSSSLPSKPAQCSILGQIAITGYDSTGIYPKETIARSYAMDARESYPLDAVKKHCESQGLTGGWASNLDLVLDDIIQLKLVP